MVHVNLDKIQKTFDDGTVVAVDEIDLDIEDGEFLVLVGPSGCGKSTTLRCIAGLEIPSSGTITFDDYDVTDYPPKDRNVSMVFQNYALYPSMTTRENMSFGLKMRDRGRDVIQKQVQWAANIMGIEDLLDRYPSQLSGGQQQRVALGRAIVRDPSLFLLDEPLSNLDAKLRTEMRTEIQELQRELDVTAVFVTHDQEEAMTMGDRIAVMNDGKIEQIDSPERIYHNPRSLFVADFIGSPNINFFDVTYRDSTIVHEKFEKSVPDDVATALESAASADLTLGIRPGNMSISDASDGLFEATVEVVEPIGERYIIYFDIDGSRKRLSTHIDQSITEDETIGIDFDWPLTHYFDANGELVTKWNEATATTDDDLIVTEDG